MSTHSTYSPALVNNGQRQHVYVEPLADFLRNIRRRIRSYLNPHNFVSSPFRSQKPSVDKSPQSVYNDTEIL